MYRNVPITAKLQQSSGKIYKYYSSPYCMIRKEEIGNEEIQDKIKLHLKNNTYSFLKISSGDYYKIYNGFILEDHKDSIIFKDDLLGPIPILKSEIQKIDVSNRIRRQK
jgi:hypothetical protein